MYATWGYTGVPGPLPPFHSLMHLTKRQFQVFFLSPHHVTWHLQRAPWWPEQPHAPEMIPTTNHMKILRMNTSIFGRLLASFLHSSLSKTS